MERRKHGFLSSVFAAQAQSSFQARVSRLRHRGGHVGFTEDSDLYVADSVGRMVRSLAEQVEEQKRGGMERKT